MRCAPRAPNGPNRLGFCARQAGEYLLSWRWDCEESTQVWQNCADVVLV